MLAHTPKRHTTLEVIHVPACRIHELVCGVPWCETNHWCPRMTQVKHNDQAAENHIAKQHPLKAGGRRLDARAVIGIEPPVGEGNLELVSTDGNVDGHISLDDIHQPRVRWLQQQTPKHRIWHDKAARAAVKDSRNRCLALGLSSSGKVEQLVPVKSDRRNGDTILGVARCLDIVHATGKGVRIVPPQMQFCGAICGDEGEDAASKDVLVGRIPSLVAERKEERLWDARHCGVWHAQPQDAVDAVEIGAVALRDAPKLGLCVVSTHLHHILSYVAPEPGSVGIGERKANKQDVGKGEGLRRVELVGFVHEKRGLLAHLYDLSAPH
mmetsp:Transcript_18526/g.46721  ORF Transcript_18526/g.46721 Transcript_18526/m.46721 type:complete len:325 (+) Transcript_18526:384-1358(+)